MAKLTRLFFLVNVVYLNCMGYCGETINFSMTIMILIVEKVNQRMLVQLRLRLVNVRKFGNCNCVVERMRFRFLRSCCIRSGGSRGGLGGLEPQSDF